MSPGEIKKLVDSLKGLSVTEISKKLKIGRTTIYRMKRANWVEPPPKRSTRGRPRVEDRIKIAARTMVEAISGPSKTDPEDVQRSLGAEQDLLNYINGLPMATSDEIRRACTELFGRAVAKGSMMALNKDTKPKEYVAIMGIVNESMRIISDPAFGLAIPDSLRIIQGETVDVEKLDERDRQLRELLLDDAA